MVGADLASCDLGSGSFEDAKASDWHEKLNRLGSFLIWFSCAKSLESFLT